MDFPVLVFETDLSAVTAPSRAGGWVSGSIANLAASAAVTCLFDLGPDWQQYNELVVAVKPAAPSSGLTGVMMTSRDDATAASNFNRQLGHRYGSAANGNAISGAPTTSATWNVRPMGRYLTVVATNADAVNAQGAGAKLTVAAFPR